MLSEARDWADKRGLGGRVNYLEGDFVELDDKLAMADICLLDKVVCCYPDAQGLLRKATAKTRRAFALTYPRDRWFVELGVGAWNALLWLIRSDFRTYVHEPARVESCIVGDGLEKCYEGRTAGWLTQVFVRRDH